MTHHSYDYLDEHISNLRKIIAFLNYLEEETACDTQRKRICIAHKVLADEVRKSNRQKSIIKEEECKLKFQNERISQFILENPKRIY